ncbi:HAMP domain-containing histidine kinase [Sulfurimonas sp. SAG-AH-194-C21]|nr:HAMP domain-containing sensor histidine kinase [Sulfurimonas sp. SAG-AH-194-C21]MDF1883175.1 HAMP domain-containing histidine kinase [Sulfurimonas sp. SAG-AH-194-C21]
MKKVELESLIKSFILFFVSQTLLIGALFFLEYNKETKSLDESLFSAMQVCSYDLKCDNFSIDFVIKEKFELNKLHKDEDGLSGYFAIGGSQKNALKIHYEKEQYKESLSAIQNDLVLKFLIVLVLVVLLSVFFSFYTLSPLRNALKMTEEFIKDILHDFNTPLSTLRLNISMLKNEIRENKKIQRIENSVETILSLQSHLRAYLENHVSQKEKFVLEELIQERVALLDKMYRGIKFEVKLPKRILYTNRDAFVRIIDNLLSNAAKYNKEKGRVSITIEDNNLRIKDTGKGIQDRKKVFQRFYKEQDRGIGIGLHIVKKLCEELKITIRLNSKVDKGSTFYLSLKNVTSES